VGRVRVIQAIARLNIGGAASHVVLLTAGTRARYPAVLATGTKSIYEGDMAPLATEHGVPVVRIPGLARDVRLLSDVRAFWELWRLCRRLKPDVVHTHTAKAGTLGRLAAWLAGVPVRVHTFHGHVFRGNFSRWKSAIYLAIERVLTRITTKIIVLSPRQADELGQYLRVGPDVIRVIPLGYDLVPFVTPSNRAALRARFRAAIGAGDGDVVITMVARLTAVKNQTRLLHAFAAVDPAARRTALLVLVGGGEDEPRLRELAVTLGIADRVRFAGWWTGAELPAVYHGSEIIALSSEMEGTPVCLIEALACGRAVVAVDVGGVADVLEDGRLGVLVPPGSAEQFAAGLTRLLDPAERVQFERQDRSRLLARYGFDRMIADVEALYDGLAISAR
jgi:glycosyltransferase involved in cell wall biosynthesis